MIGSRERSAACELAPSASAMCSSHGIAAGLHDVRDARGEHTALAGELLVDAVGDPMRCQPQVAGRRDIRKPVELRLLDGIEQTEAHVIAAVGQSPHTADDQRIGAARSSSRQD